MNFDRILVNRLNIKALLCVMFIIPILLVLYRCEMLFQEVKFSLMY